MIFLVAGGSMIFGAVGRAVRADAGRGELRCATWRIALGNTTLRDEEFLFPHEVARREQVEEKAQERQESAEAGLPKCRAIRRLRSLRAWRLRTPPED